MVSTVTSQQEGSWLESQLEPFSVHGVCMFSPSTSGFSLGTLAPPPPKNMHVRLTGDSKLRSKCEPEWLFSLVLICVDL